MAWTTMHFAVGMGCTGATVGAACLTMRRGWRWLPFAMTLGGVFALTPDLPRIWRQDLTWLPFASILGSIQLEKTLHEWGNVFFFHRALDAQPHEYALHGLVLILVLYNASIALLMHLERRQRNSLANRAWRAHSRAVESRRRHGHRERTRTPRRDDTRKLRPDVIYRIEPDEAKETG